MQTYSSKQFACDGDEFANGKTLGEILKEIENKKPMYSYAATSKARRRGRTFRAVCFQIILCLFGYLLILWLFGAGKCMAADYQPRYDLPNDWSIQLKLCQHNHDCYDRVLRMFGQTEI